MTKATEVEPGVQSTMRIAVLFYCLPIGAVLSVGGLVGWFFRYPDASVFVGAGVGLIMGALGAKAWQAQVEK